MESRLMYPEPPDPVKLQPGKIILSQKPLKLTNLKVRIIDLVSHTTYVVCVNFIQKWRDLQFKVDSEQQIL